MTAPQNPPGSEPEVRARLLDEGLISLKKAAELVPTSSGRPVRIKTLVRWIVHGKQGVKLEATRAVGEHWWTSKPALARFLAKLPSVLLLMWPA